MTKHPSEFAWVPPTEPDDYCKCSVCKAGWLRKHAIVVGGEIFCSNECCEKRAIDLLLEQPTKNVD